MKPYFYFLILFFCVGATAHAASLGPFQYSTGSGAAAKMLPNISLMGSFAGGYFSTDPVGDTGHDPSRTGFNLQEIEVAIQSIVDPYFRGDIFLGFVEDGVELEEGFITTTSLPKGFQIRAGKFKLPFGRQNQKHLHTWSFIDNNLVDKYLLGPEGVNELGVELSYLAPTPFFLQAQFTFSNGDNDTSFGGTRKEDFLYEGRLSSSLDISKNTTVLLGTSTATGFNNTAPGNKTMLYGGDLLVKWKPKASRSVAWQTEVIARNLNNGAHKHDGGLSSYVDFQFSKRWHAGLRYDLVGIPSDTVTKENRVTPAMTFAPTEFSLLRLQYAYDKPRAADAIHSIFLQTQFSMGPHGAHTF